MLILGNALLLLINAYMVLMWARLILDWVTVLVRGFRPKGLVLVLAELVYTLTDPPLKFLRRWIKPLRVGEIALDLSWIVLFFGLSILGTLIRSTMIYPNL